MPLCCFVRHRSNTDRHGTESREKPACAVARAVTLSVLHIKLFRLVFSMCLSLVLLVGKHIRLYSAKMIEIYLGFVVCQLLYVSRG